MHDNTFQNYLSDRATAPFVIPAEQQTLPSFQPNNKPYRHSGRAPNPTVIPAEL